MSLQLAEYVSTASLLEAAPAWDDLWRRSDVTLPTACAEFVTQWLQHFAPQSRFHCLAVEDQGQLVAAIPLVGRKIGRVVPAGGLPRNDWSPGGGELLLDPTADVDQALDLLVAGLRDVPWPLLWLDDVNIDASRYQALLAAFQRAKINVDVHSRFDVGRVATDGDWSEYVNSRSKNFRRQIKRAIKRAEGEGELKLNVLTEFSGDELETHLRQAFEIEDRGWKGEGQTSVLKTPGMFEFFVRQAKVLAQNGQLQLSFLQHNDRAIAFEYGLNAKGVYHGFKISYDDEFSDYSPGRVLLHLILERMFENSQWHEADRMGPITASTSSFITSKYTIGRMVAAPKAMFGKTLLNFYQTCWPAVRRVRKSVRKVAALPTIKWSKATHKATSQQDNPSGQASE